MKKPESASCNDQLILDNQRVRLAVRRYYASVADPTKIVDGFPKRDPAAVEACLDEAA